MLEDVVYVPESPDQILSLMKFRRQHSGDFKFTSLEEFTFATPTGFTLTGRSINDILYTWVEPSTRIMAVQTRSESRKRSQTEANLDSGAELSEKAGYKTPEPIGRQKHKRARSPVKSAVQLGENFHPLNCHPQNLWHLRFGHSSATTLQKLKSIKSNFDSSTCHVCIRAK